MKYDEIIGGRYYQIRISGRETIIAMCVTGWPAVKAHDPEGKRKNPPRGYAFVGPRFGRQHIFCDQIERELRPEEQEEQRIKRNAYRRRRSARERATNPS